MKYKVLSDLSLPYPSRCQNVGVTIYLHLLSQLHTLALAVPVARRPLPVTDVSPTYPQDTY